MPKVVPTKGARPARRRSPAGCRRRGRRGKSRSRGPKGGGSGAAARWRARTRPGCRSVGGRGAGGATPAALRQAEGHAETEIRDASIGQDARERGVMRGSAKSPPAAISQSQPWRIGTTRVRGADARGRPSRGCPRRRRTRGTRGDFGDRRGGPIESVRFAPPPGAQEIVQGHRHGHPETAVGRSSRRLRCAAYFDQGRSGSRWRPRRTEPVSREKRRSPNIRRL